MTKKSAQFVELIGCLNEVVPLIKKELVNFNKEKNVAVGIVIYQNILQRLYYCIQSIEILLYKFQKDTNFKFTIGLIIRNGLLDFIIAQYLFENGHLKRNLIKEFARINHQYVYSEVKEYQNQRNKGRMSEEEFENNLKVLKYYYPENFLEQDKNGIPIIDKKINSISPKKMTECLQQDSNVYNLYHYYSQYAHFGRMSKLMLDGNSEYDFDKMKLALCYILTGVNCCFHIMNISKEKLRKVSNIGKSIISLPEI